jgi:hypothetical protein
MRLHTDNLSAADLRECLPDGVLAHISAHGSRKRDHAFEVTLYVLDKDDLHRRYGNSGGYGASDEVAATWDEWGIWMARLYEREPSALIGWYESPEHFRSVTLRERLRHEAQYKPTSVAYRTHRAPWLDWDDDMQHMTTEEREAGLGSFAPEDRAYGRVMLGLT